jgi:hypothetical protein
MLLQAQALATEDAAGEGFMRLYLMQQVNALYWRKASLTSMAGKGVVNVAPDM